MLSFSWLMETNLGVGLGVVMVVLLVSGIGLLLRRLATAAEDQQRERIENRTRISPIPTSSPIDNPLRQAKQRALESLGLRFTIIRNLLTAVVVALLLIVLSVPLLGALPAAALSAVFGVVVVVTGVAARPVFENLMAGIILTLSGAVRVADTVIIDGSYGTVEDIKISHTVVKVWNWRRHVIPNSVLMSKDFLNLTLHDQFLWTHVEFWVEPAADLEAVKREAIAAAESAPTFAGHERPCFWVMEMAKDGIRCWIAAWANNPADSWELAHHVRTELSGRLSKLGVLCQEQNIRVQTDAPSMGQETKSSTVRRAGGVEL